MKVQFERRLRRLEGETKSIERLNFRNVSPDDLARMKKIFLTSQETGDWSGFLRDLARDAPTAYDAYRKAGFSR